ncbi:MAG: DUF4974 domain-containing protein [Odoribacter sp.]
MDSKIKEWITTAQKISKYILNRNDLSSQQETKKWYQSGERHKKIFNDLNSAQYYTHKSIQRKKINEKYTYEDFTTSYKIKIHRIRWQKIGYAASILILLASATTIWFYQQQDQEQTIAFMPHIIPGSSKASLILGNGNKIALNSPMIFNEKDGTIIQNKTDGELTYQGKTKNNLTIQYNTLLVPQGGEYRLTLSDGTKVWINSESELIFPTQFSSDKREVFLKGEAYFEIAHNKHQPFYVNSNQLQIHATGTAFNVNAYTNEPNFKVTLVEGSVNIEGNNKIISKLPPNFQFSMNKEKGEYEVISVDPRTATSWKNGIFFFDEESLSSIIRKLSRWYGINIKCTKPEINQYKFSGEIRKYEEISKVLDILKLTNEITYNILSDKSVVLYPTE